MNEILDESGQPIFRGKNFGREDQERLVETYKIYGTLFSLRIHHGGRFTDFPGRQYVNGEEVIADYIDSDKFSVPEFNYYVRKLGYDEEEMMLYHFKKPDLDLDIGLVEFATDLDVRNMINFVGKYDILDFYIEHGMPTVGSYWKSNAQSSVVIEELVHEGENVDVVVRPISYRRLLLEGPSGEDNVEVPGVQADVEGGPSVQETVEGSPRVQENVEGGPSVQEAVENDDHWFKKHMERSDMVNDVEVDMSSFKKHSERDDHWFKKGVEAGIGNLEVNDELVGIDFDEYDSGEGSDVDKHGRRKRLRKLKRQRRGLQGKEVCSPFYVGKSFLCPKQIKSLIRSHAVESRRELKIVKNDKERIRVVCEGKVPCYKKTRKGQEESSTKANKEDFKGKKVISENKGCPWTLYVSKTDQEDHWYVKTHNDQHKCLQTRQLRWASSKFLSEHIADTVAANPEISGRALQDYVQKKYELGFDRQLVYRAKDIAMKRIRGDYVEQYALLRDYILELQTRNPDTTVKLDVEVEPNPASETRFFKRIYICLGSLKRGYKAAGRELLGLDGAFMKGPFPGQVLSAVGVDPNNGIYPLAYGIVEAETKASWTWFLSCLGEDLDLTRDCNYTFISDRQKGIIPAIATLYPNAEHRFCLRHIHENLKSVCKGGDVYKELLWKCATSTTVPEFERAMGEIKMLSTKAHDWLRDIPPKHWARSHFSGRAKCDILLNNICESFNSKLVEGRDRPIITCLEYIREYLMRRIVIVQKLIEKSQGPLTPSATFIFEETKTQASKYTVTWNGGDQYQVSGPWQDQSVVDMRQRVCTCRKWELTGLPCKHVVATIWDMALNGIEVGIPEDWVHPAYRWETWKEVYGFKVMPVTGVSTWPKSECSTKLLPPHHHTQVGRPTKKRKRSALEKLAKPMVQGGRLSRAGKTVTCAKCKQKGHNSKTCKGQRGGPGKQPQKQARKQQKSGPKSGQASQAGSAAGSQGGKQVGVGVVTQRTQLGSQEGIGTQGSTSAVPTTSPTKVACKRFSQSKWFPK